MENPSADGPRLPTPLRRSANYPPTIWEDSYIQSLPDISLDVKQVDLWEKLKEEVRNIISLEKQRNVIELLELIDVLRQLGISYHFESEIKIVLNFIASSLGGLSNILIKDLHGSALSFRIFREYGYKIPILREGVLLKNFENVHGRLDDNNLHDIKGMLSLYEASYLTVEGEDKLEVARDFIAKHLSALTKKPFIINPVVIEQINHALEEPLHWRIPRLHTRWFIDAYEKQESINPNLLDFAKLDYKLMQNLYRKELKELSRWWKNLGLIGDEFKFTRDRLLELFYWSVECSFEPQFWRCRMENTKISCLLTTIDDIFDIYGLLDELELCTTAVAEWNISRIESLPNCIRKTFKALFDTSNDLASDVMIKKGFDILPFLRKMWKDLCEAYLLEARWFYTGYTPTLNEYLENGWVSITIPLLMTLAYCISEDLTEESLKSYEFYHDVTHYSSMITRLYDDLGTAIDEVQRGDVPKSIQCYMKEVNTSELAARDHIKLLIRKNWKMLNKEYINKFNLEETFKHLALNCPRWTQYIHQNGDRFANPECVTKDHLIYLFIDPISL